jgi:hypothetical protein
MCVFYPKCYVNAKPGHRRHTTFGTLAPRGSWAGDVSPRLIQENRTATEIILFRFIESFSYLLLTMTFRSQTGYVLALSLRPPRAEGMPDLNTKKAVCRSIIEKVFNLFVSHGTYGNSATRGMILELLYSHIRPNKPRSISNFLVRNFTHSDILFSYRTSSNIYVIGLLPY